MKIKMCAIKPGSTECWSHPCVGVMACDGVDSCEVPAGLEIDQRHPLKDKSRVGSDRPRLKTLKMPKRVTIEVKEEIADLLLALDKEHCYSCSKWGHDFDDQNTINDWVAFVNQYLALATPIMATDNQIKAGFTKAMNLCLNALAALKRNGKFPGRHYD